TCLSFLKTGFPARLSVQKEPPKSPLLILKTLKLKSTTVSIPFHFSTCRKPSEAWVRISIQPSCSGTMRLLRNLSAEWETGTSTTCLLRELPGLNLIQNNGALSTREIPG